MSASSLGGINCPLCQSPLIQSARCLSCENNHTFDRAKTGYFNLLNVQFKKSKQPGDSKEMVKSRSRFLNNDAYEPIAELLAKILNHCNLHEGAFICDAGCGEGYYLDQLRQRLNIASCNFLGFDISKDAIHAASKRSSEIDWLVASIKQDILRPGTVDAMLCMFGFPDFSQFFNAIRKGGHLIMVDPTQNHLQELKALIYRNAAKDKSDRLADASHHGFESTQIYPLEYKTTLGNQSLNDLIDMTPHAFKADRELLQVAREKQELAITVSVRFKLLKKSN